jgi:hypothetical protein
MTEQQPQDGAGIKTASRRQREVVVAVVEKPLPTAMRVKADDTLRGGRSGLAAR